jgi:hypothetical protein
MNHYKLHKYNPYTWFFLHTCLKFQMKNLNSKDYLKGGKSLI